jgi:hypothetical protein
MTQVERVLHAARRAGPRGITAVDFLAPDVCDGGKPITRLAARINDLEHRGFKFRDGGRRQSTKVYVLDRVPVTFAWPDTPPEPADTTVRLFDPVVGSAPPRGAYDDAA